MPTLAAHLCAYCITTELTGDEKPEHVIPASLGASLTVPTVCNACNEWAGREIDQPFLADQMLREYRAMPISATPGAGPLGEFNRRCSAGIQLRETSSRLTMRRSGR